eukprot:1453020-Amphidinium_carterae.1
MEELQVQDALAMLGAGLQRDFRRTAAHSFLPCFMHSLSRLPKPNLAAESCSYRSWLSALSWHTEALGANLRLLTCALEAQWIDEAPMFAATLTASAAYFSGIPGRSRQAVQVINDDLKFRLLPNWTYSKQGIKAVSYIRKEKTLES